jgi:hypothetical protein
MTTTSHYIAAASLLLWTANFAAAAPAEERVLRFDSDPGWESFRSRLAPDPPPLVRQNFGWRPTNRARGKAAGEIGGWVQRSLTPAFYGMAIPVRTLEEKLTASGTFAVTQSGGGSGALFGWFHDQSRGWRTPNSLAFRIDGNGANYWMLFEYGTRHWLTGGEGTFEGRYQTTKSKPYDADGTPHRWTLAYDPAGNSGDGLVTFTLDGKSWHVPVAPGHKADGAEFNRFGFFNQQTTGDGVEFFVDDLEIDGRAIDFASDPDWDARGNRAEYPEKIVRPMHDLGYSKTAHAGGAAGEVGGTMFRDEQPAFYAGKTGPLSLNHELLASGKLAFTGAGSDSGLYLGWFDSTSKKNKSLSDYKEPQKNFMAIAIEGPSRIGHYFRPAYAASDGKGELKEEGPIIRPDGKVHHWSLHYRPDGAGGNGQITVRFDDDTQTLDLKPGHKQSGATFDRFGFFNMQSGGWHVQVYVDDLTYSKARQ